MDSGIRLKRPAAGDAMGEALAKPRTGISARAPRIVSITLPKEKIRDVIGKGGATIRSIIDASGCSVNIDDNGICPMAGPNPKKFDIALKMIGDLIQTAEVGQTYLGKVARIRFASRIPGRDAEKGVAFGAFLTLLPGLDGLLHVSGMAPYRVKSPADEVSEGQEILVKCIGSDEKNGKIKLSRSPPAARRGPGGPRQRRTQPPARPPAA